MNKIKKYFNSSINKITVGLGILKVLKVLLSVGVIALSARLFGVNQERDFWVLGVTIISVILQMIFGPINETFRTQFIHLRENENFDSLMDRVHSLLSTVLILCSFICLLIFLKSDFVIQLFVPGFSNFQKIGLKEMIFFLIPSLFLLQIINLLSAILNSFNSFYLPDLFGFISIFINLILLYILTPYIGIYSLVISSYLSSLLLIFFIVRELKFKHNFNLKFVLPKFSLVAPFFIFSFPLYFNYLLTQSDTIVEKALLSNFINGSISLLDYAKRFADMSISLIMSVITTVLTPILTYKFCTSEFKSVVVETQNYFRIIVLLVIPLSTILVVLSKQIIGLLLYGGNFTISNLITTSELLSFYGLGVFFSTVYVIYSQLMIVQKKVLLFSVFLIIVYVLKILFNLSFYDSIGINIFPISWAGTYFILSMIFSILSTNKFKFFVLTDMFKIYTLFSVMIVSGLLLVKFLKPLINNFELIIVVSGLIIIIELILVFILKMEERFKLINFYNFLKSKF